MQGELYKSIPLDLKKVFLHEVGSGSGRNAKNQTMRLANTVTGWMPMRPIPNDANSRGVDLSVDGGPHYHRPVRIRPRLRPERRIRNRGHHSRTRRLVAQHDRCLRRAFTPERLGSSSRTIRRGDMHNLMNRKPLRSNTLGNFVLRQYLKNYTTSLGTGSKQLTRINISWY